MADKKSLVNIDFGGVSSIKNLPSASPASSDCIVMTDEIDGGKAKKGPSFGTNDGKFLRHDGSWVTPGDANYYHKTGTWSGLTYTAAKVGNPDDLVITIPTGTSASTVCVGNDPRLSNARPASDVSSWAKAATKPSYNLDEVPDGSTRKLADYLPLSGGTLTGNLNLKADQYNREGALNCNNSDIIGVNSIYTMDTADNTAEGIRFYRDSTHYDSFTMSGGKMYFMPNDSASGTSFSSANVVLHSGNISSYAVTAIGSRTGSVTIANLKSDLGLGSAAYVNTGSSSGNVPVLDSSGKLPTGILPALAVTDTFTAASQAAMLALSAQKGDICIRTDENKTYVLSAEPASTLANWKQLLTPTDANSYHSTGTWSGLTYTAANNGGAPDLVFTIPTGTTASTVCAGNDSRLSDARPASDVYSWAKAASKPTYTASEVGALASNGTAVNSSKLNNQAASYYLDYNNFTNTPTIPAAQVNSDWNASSGVAQILNKPTLATVATSGSYNDLTNKPSIPAKDSDLTNDRYVRYDTNAQGLTSTQKANARTNIGAGTSNLTIGNTANTAAAGDHLHDGRYLQLGGGELSSDQVPILTLYNKQSGTTLSSSSFLDFRYSGQAEEKWRIGVNATDKSFYVYRFLGSTDYKYLTIDERTADLYTYGDIYENGTKLSNKYQATLVSGTNIKTINGASLLGSGNIFIGYQPTRVYRHNITINIVNGSYTTRIQFCVTNTNVSPCTSSVDGAMAYLCGTFSNNSSSAHRSTPVQISQTNGQYVYLLMDYKVWYSHSGSNYVVDFQYDEDDATRCFGGESYAYCYPEKYYRYMSFTSSQVSVADVVEEV